MTESSKQSLNQNLLIIAFNESEGGSILERSLAGRFDFDIRRIEAPLPEVRVRSGQASADDLLSEVCRLRVAHSSDIALGVTDVDMFVSGMNFVFGLASKDGACAVVSSNRLRGDERERFSGRLVKEAVHEIGHVLGLSHCDDSRCVMHFSNSLRDTDLKRDTFCPKCSVLLADMIGSGDR